MKAKRTSGPAVTTKAQRTWTDAGLVDVPRSWRLKCPLMELLTVPEAAEILGISRAAVYTAIREERLASVRVLGKIGILKSELKNYRPMQVRIESGKRSAESKGLGKRKARKRR